MHPRSFSKHLQHEKIVTAIRTAEQKTSGKIHVSFSPKHVADALAGARSEFLRLGLNKSADRNNVLIFVAPRAQKFAVIGDEAVHAKCGDEFWRQLAAAMSEHFRQNNFTTGIVHGVEKAGELLAAHFPSREPK